MARTSAIIQFDLWRRPTFRGLQPMAQLTYLVIRTWESTSRCGVTPLVVDAWAEGIGTTADLIANGVAELAERALVHVDRDERELFIPDSIRDEHLAKMPSVLERAIRDAEVIRSDMLRRLVAAELRAVGVPRAVEAASFLEREERVPDDPRFRNPHATTERTALRRMRANFGKCAGRRRLRAEIDAGMHACPCGAVANLQIDHIVPLARGGTNDFGNLQVLCGPCNNRKGAS